MFTTLYSINLSSCLSLPMITGLHFVKAAGANDTKIVNEYIRSGGDLEAKDELGRTAIVEAAVMSCYDVIKILIEAGANVNAESEFGNTPLMLLTTKSNATEIIKLLIDVGADVNHINTINKTALICAVKVNLLKNVAILLEAGADLNIVDAVGKTALNHAKGECYDLIKKYIDKEQYEYVSSNRLLIVI